MTFIEFPSFDRARDRYLTELDVLALQLYLKESPTVGVFIKGTGGLRKLRWTSSKTDLGKRGSLRIIYFLFNKQECWLIAVYAKNEVSILTHRETSVIRAMIASELQKRST